MNSSKLIVLFMIKKYLNPQNDIAFKRIFGSEKNKEILLALLNSVLIKQLHRAIKEANFLPRVQDPETAAKKTSAVDLMCKDEDGCLYIIEMVRHEVAHMKSVEKQLRCIEFLNHR